MYGRLCLNLSTDHQFVSRFFCLLTAKTAFNNCRSFNCSSYKIFNQMSTLFRCVRTVNYVIMHVPF